MYLLANIPQRLTNTSGSPAQYMYTYTTGTTTLKTAYTDQAGATPHANPIEASADGTFAQVWLDSDTEYRIKVVCQDGTTLFTWDDVSGAVSSADLTSTSDSTKGAALAGYYDPVAPTFLKTTSDILNGLPVSILRFIPKTEWSAIAAATSTLDVSTHFNTAASAAKRIDINRGKYRLNSKVTIPQDVQWRGFNKQNTILEFVGSAGIEAVSGVGGAYDIVLSGFYIKGDNSGAGRHGLFIDGTASNFGRVALDDLVISNFSGDGLKLIRPIVTQLRNIQSSSNGAKGFDIVGDGTSVTMTGCYAASNTSDGIYVNANLQYSALIACASDTNGGNGYWFEGSIASPAEGITLVSCGSETNTGDQFKFTAALGLTLTSVFTFPGSPAAGGHYINLDGCRDVSLNGISMRVAAPVGKYALNIGNLGGTQFPARIRSMGCNFVSVNDAYRSYSDLNDAAGTLTFKSGTTGAISNGATVTHDLGVTPTQVLVSTDNSTLVCAADNFTATTFRLLVQDNAGGFPAARAYRWTVIA